jgi:hypothetical protein
MNIAEGMIKHSIIVGVEKPKRGIAIKAVLEKLGYRALITSSVYELVRLATQEMPHLVITEAVLTDGTAAAVHDKLKSDACFANTPILALILKKTKQELEVLQGRGFAGFLLGDLQGPTFIAKVKQILSASNQLSPYFVNASAMGINPHFDVLVEARAMCRSGDYAVFISKLELDSSASFTGGFPDKKKPPVVLALPSNVRMGDEVLNFFPISRLKGEGRSWLMDIPEISMKQTSKVPRRVLFFDPDQKRFETFKQVLGGYDIELTRADTLTNAATMIGRDLTYFGAVYLHETPSNPDAQVWKQMLDKIPVSKRPPIVRWDSMPVKSAVAGSRRAFGLGMLVELLEGCFERGEQFAGKDLKSIGVNLPVNFEASARILGLDEVGGLLEIKFPVSVGAKIDLPHEFLKKVWQGATLVTVLGVAALKDAPDTWQVFFEAVPAGTSKAKYWEKVSRHLASVPKSAA